MLYIIRSGQPVSGWHVGEPRPLEIAGGAGSYVHEVIEIQADGDELAYIERHFTNLKTVPGARSVNWFGDDAKFIVKNLV